MKSLFNTNREDFEAKWNDIKIVIEYGMLSEDKFFEKSNSGANRPRFYWEMLKDEKIYWSIKFRNRP